MLLQNIFLVLLSSVLLGLNTLALPTNAIDGNLPSTHDDSTQLSKYQPSTPSFRERLISYIYLSSTLSSLLPPQPQSKPSSLHRRADADDLSRVPSVEDIEKQLPFAPNTALFWSGERDKARHYAEKHGLQTMDMAITGDTPWNTKWLKEKKIKHEYWDRASIAMVNVVSGTVYVMLRGGKDDPITHPGTVWTRKEWPFLEAGTNKKIEKVIRINPKGEEVGQIWPKV